MNYSHLLMNEPPGAQRRRLLLIYSCCGLRTWQAIGAVFGLGGGIIAVVLGSLLSAVALITGDQSGGFGLHGVGAVFLFLTIPLLLLGGHCMDLLERSGKAPNIESKSQPGSRFKTASFQSRPDLSKRELEERIRLQLLLREQLHSGAHSRRRARQLEN